MSFPQHRSFSFRLASGLGIVALTGCIAHHAGPAGTGSRMVVDDAYLARGKDRSFAIRYEATVKDVPAGAKTLRLWLPVPQTTNLQAITGLEFSGPAQPRLTAEPKYGNMIAYVELSNPPAGTHTWRMAFQVRRREVKVALGTIGSERADPDGSYKVFSDADRLVVITDDVRDRAKKAVAGKSGSIEKARAIYQSVMGSMTYDKSGTGWGRGDVRYACDVGKGNCTDFHALFNAMCRAEGIASGFEIGLFLPYDAKPGADWEKSQSGYHCWAAFRVPGRTWVPVDISEADRFPERADYFFGAHTANRVTLSVGRDLKLEPAQDGDALNYFLDPYAEVDGKPQLTAKVWHFRDL